MEEKMSYTEFVWFLMAEEDKRHPRAVEYWFRWDIPKKYMFNNLMPYYTSFEYN